MTRTVTTSIHPDLYQAAKSIAAVDNKRQRQFEPVLPLSVPSPVTTAKRPRMKSPLSTPPLAGASSDLLEGSVKGLPKEIIPVSPPPPSPLPLPALFEPISPIPEDSSEEEEEKDLDVSIEEQKKKKVSKIWSPLVEPGGLLRRLPGSAGVRSLPVCSKADWKKQTRRNTREEAVKVYNNIIYPSARYRGFTHALGDSAECREAMISLLQTMPAHLFTSNYASNPTASLIDFESYQDPGKEIKDYAYRYFAEIPHHLIPSYIKHLEGYLRGKLIHARNVYYFAFAIEVAKELQKNGKKVFAYNYAGFGGGGEEIAITARPEHHFGGKKNDTFFKEQIASLKNFNESLPLDKKIVGSFSFIALSPRHPLKSWIETYYVEIAVSTTFNTAIVQGGSNVNSTGFDMTGLRASLCYWSKEHPSQTIESTLTRLEVPVSFSLGWNKLKYMFDSRGENVVTCKELWEIWGKDFTLEEKKETEPSKIACLRPTSFAMSSSTTFATYEQQFRDWDGVDKNLRMDKIRLAGFTGLSNELKLLRRRLPAGEFENVLRHAYLSARNTKSVDVKEFILNLVDRTTLTQGVKVWANATTDASAKYSRVNLYLYLKLSTTGGQTRYVNHSIRFSPRTITGRGLGNGAHVFTMRGVRKTRTILFFERDGITPIYSTTKGNTTKSVEAISKSDFFGEGSAEMLELLE